jgi:ubiquinone/menaquinone biosynthesis C-methylase UbiE
MVDRSLPALWGIGLLVILAWTTGCPSQEAGVSAQPYEQRERQDPEGTGRYYMGREIARGTGQASDAAWRDSSGREVAELPNRVVQALELRPDDTVADIGAGTGYFTFRLAGQVPQGQVLAVDIEPAMLDTIRHHMADHQVANVVPIRGTETNPNLPVAAVDVALLVVSYHEFSHPREMMEGIVAALKPGGRLVLVEYRGEDTTLPVPPLRRMTEAQARKEMEAVGLRWRETRPILPQQHFMVFEKGTRPP